jgi:hypothetical protein
MSAVKDFTANVMDNTANVMANVSRFDHQCQPFPPISMLAIVYGFIASRR